MTGQIPTPPEPEAEYEGTEPMQIKAIDAAVGVNVLKVNKGDPFPGDMLVDAIEHRDGFYDIFASKANERGTYDPVELPVCSIPEAFVFAIYWEV